LFEKPAAAVQADMGQPPAADATTTS
jgi:hypothetical protein